ncbi:aminotransferase class V-fold PLP-dependent enzyme [Cohnella hongkongensis]|uniref:Phosphoserine aminotransferase n=1 Tax=Cohnella hongkongensis TaxID=178337 RepID=A0ABV9FIH3_9BACL
MTAVIVREELLRAGSADIPAIFQYRTYADNGSLYNTPPVHAIYMMKLMLEWTARQGGIPELEKRNERKIGFLYEAIDAGDGFYRGIVEKPYRSMMNATWRMADEALEKRFVLESEREGFVGLAGHRSVGGLRASAYNAVPEAACKALAEFMNDFRRRCG